MENSKKLKLKEVEKRDKEILSKFGSFENYNEYLKLLKGGIHETIKPLGRLKPDECPLAGDMTKDNYSAWK